MADTWMGDDFFHQGAFRQTQGLVFSRSWRSTRRDSLSLDRRTTTSTHFYLRHPTLDSLAKATGVARFPSWVGFATHPALRRLLGGEGAAERAHQRRRSRRSSSAVGGTRKTSWGRSSPITRSRSADSSALEPHRARPVVPRRWAAARRRFIRTDSASAVRRPTTFATKSSDPGSRTTCTARVTGASPRRGSSRPGRTSGAPSTPGRRATSQRARLYLREDGTLSSTRRRHRRRRVFAAPFDAYISDPAHPVPYMPRPDDGEGWRTWLRAGPALR